MTRFTTTAAVALVALLLPVAAVAKEANVTGPTALAGAGFFGGELATADTDAQRPVRITGAPGGYVGFLDLGGDLKVRCLGKARLRTHETDDGTVFMCAGRGVTGATALGSHVKLRGFATRYRVLVPKGVRGTWNGRFTAEGEGSRRQAEPKRDAPKREAPKAGGQTDEEVPTLAELAALLAAQGG